MSDGLLREIRITHILDCLADTARIRVLAELSDDVREALPYLAALLPQAGYNHAASLLTVVRDGRLITVYPQAVTLAKAVGEEDAQAVLEWLRRLINEAYSRRGELVPCLERRRVPRLLDVYRLLPGDNCRRCGQFTCMAMAAHIVFDGLGPDGCPRLREAEFTRNRRLLMEWLVGEG